MSYTCRINTSLHNANNKDALEVIVDQPDVELVHLGQIHSKRILDPHILGLVPILSLPIEGANEMLGHSKRRIQTLGSILLSISILLATNFSSLILAYENPDRTSNVRV